MTRGRLGTRRIGWPSPLATIYLQHRPIRPHREHGEPRKDRQHPKKAQARGNGPGRKDRADGPKREYRANRKRRVHGANTAERVHRPDAQNRAPRADALHAPVGAVRGLREMRGRRGVRAHVLSISLAPSSPRKRLSEIPLNWNRKSGGGHPTWVAAPASYGCVDLRRFEYQR